MLDSIESLEGQILPAAIRRLLLSRGFKDEEAVKEWLAPKLSNLADPLTMKDMGLAIDRLEKAFVSQEKICIYGDFDLDGSSGLAMLFEGLKNLGYQNLFRRQPLRLSEGYGFHSHIVEELAQLGVTLVMTVDVGISANAATQRANDLGVDVIITDHHQPEVELPKALAVVNPNRKDCTSGLGYLCGTGVAFYVLRALKRRLVDVHRVPEQSLDLRKALDLFTIATLTDMVPLVEDNRPLVKAGLVQLRNTKRPGLRILLEELGLDGRPLTGQDVAIRFSPKLNALSRMEKKVLPIDIFLATDLVQAHDMVAEVIENNDERLEKQQAGDVEAQRQLATWPHPDFVFLFSDQFHRGIIGLIATKICQNLNVPTFIGSMEGSQIVGSARLPANYPVSLLTAMKAASPSLVRFGGHDSAAGFELEAPKAQDFIDALAGFYTHKDNHTENSSVQGFQGDTHLLTEEINEELMHWLDRLGPYGQGFDVPKFILKNLQIQEVRKLRGGHLKISLGSASRNKKLDALLFSPPLAWIESVEAKESIDLVGELQWNYYLKQKSIQIVAKEVRRSTISSN